MPAMPDGRAIFRTDHPSRDSAPICETVSPQFDARDRPDGRQRPDQRQDCGFEYGLLRFRSYWRLRGIGPAAMSAGAERGVNRLQASLHRADEAWRSAR